MATARPGRGRGRLVLLAALLLWPAAGAGAGAPDILASAAYLKAAPKDVCAPLIARSERAHRIPSQLLAAISLAEAGRWDAENRATFAWPWTVTAEGRSRFFPTKTAAVAEVRRLRAAGVRNIDVGCMQVNLYFHTDAFDDPGEALDPATNVAYAARFLRRLRDDMRSWSRAVAHYHSATPKLNRPYRVKVFRLWEEARRRADRARREALIEAYRQRRARRTDAGGRR